MLNKFRASFVSSFRHCTDLRGHFPLSKNQSVTSQKPIPISHPPLGYFGHSAKKNVSNVTDSKIKYFSGVFCAGWPLSAIPDQPHPLSEPKPVRNSGGKNSQPPPFGRPHLGKGVQRKNQSVELCRKLIAGKNNRKNNKTDCFADPLNFSNMFHGLFYKTFKDNHAYNHLVGTACENHTKKRKFAKIKFAFTQQSANWILCALSL